MRAPRTLRAVLAAGAFAACGLAGGSALAQFANHSIGIEGGYVYVANPASLNVGSGGQLGLMSTLYIESGFEIYFRLLVGIHREHSNGQNVVGVLPAIGFRYLLSEDHFRPYIGLNLAYLHFFMDNDNGLFGGLSPFAGFEVFVANNMSLGLQAEYHLLLSLNEAPEHAVVIVSRVAWYF